MKDKSERPRVLIILGAGASLHLSKELSTKDITENVEKTVGRQNQVVQSVINALKGQRLLPTGEGLYNFEIILAALDELEEYCTRKEHPTSYPPIEGHLSAFTELLCEFSVFNRHAVSEAHTQIIGSIKDYVIGKTIEIKPTVLKHFFCRMRKVFDLTVLTLNYDDFVDRTGDWYDGFVLSPNTTPKSYNAFDISGFQKKSVTDRAVLMHLHGSVRFSFPTPLKLPENGFDQIVRYSSPKRALCDFTLNPPPNIRPATIISGHKKDRWMTQGGVPFGFYYNSFISTILECPRILIAGYGEADYHLDSWIRMHPQIHNAQHRGVWINPCNSSKIKSGQWLRENDSFPPSDEQIDKIIAYLSSPHLPTSV